MADRRKLQGEIERCLKKVSEGVETFEDIWQKVYNAANANQKEKYEADLKKEIKKLQRLRDQIKTWLTSSDIKDKRSLQDSRKVIETQMERFKVVERETKTKAYSKEGLGAAQKLDPAQKERDEITNWLTACIESLTIQVDKFESDIDSINFNLKKKKNDKDKLDLLDDLKGRHEKHRYHINQLEALLRMLDNGTVEVDQIKNIKDDVEYYRDCHQDPDFLEQDFIYEDLNLENMDDYIAKQAASLADLQTQIEGKSVISEEENSNTPASVDSDSPSHNSLPLVENHSVEASEYSSSSSALPRPCSPIINNISSLESNSSASHVVNSKSVINSQSFSPCASTTISLPNNHQISNHHEVAWSSTKEELESKENLKSFLCPSTPERHHDGTNHVSSSNSWTRLANSWMDAEFEQEKDQAPPMHCTNERSAFSNDESQLHDSTKMDVLSSECLEGTFGVSTPLTSVIRDDEQSTLKNLAERAVLNSTLSNHAHNLQFSALQNKGSQLTHNVMGTNSMDLFTDSSMHPAKQSPSTNSAYIDVTQMFGEFPQNQFSPDQLHCLRILDVAFKHLPLPLDSQRHRYTSPGGPAPTPDYYPTNLSNSHTAEFFQRLSTETLFFIFYFLQGTRAQYLAAKALKTKSWRFHTMFMMWFQRHEEPKIINDEFEQGTYIYFDYEKWAQRKKEGFTFEYKYLEDKDLNL